MNRLMNRQRSSEAATNCFSFFRPQHTDEAARKRRCAWGCAGPRSIGGRRQPAETPAPAGPHKQGLLRLALLFTGRRLPGPSVSRPPPRYPPAPPRLTKASIEPQGRPTGRCPPPHKQEAGTRIPPPRQQEAGTLTRRLHDRGARTPVPSCPARACRHIYFHLRAIRCGRCTRLCRQAGEVADEPAEVHNVRLR